MANTSALALGTKPGAIKEDIPEGAAKIGAFMNIYPLIYTPLPIRL